MLFGAFVHIFLHALHLALYLWSVTPHYNWVYYVEYILHTLHTSFLFSFLCLCQFCLPSRFTLNCWLWSCSKPWSLPWCPVPTSPTTLHPHASPLPPVSPPVGPLLPGLACALLHCNAVPGPQAFHSTPNDHLLLLSAKLLVISHLWKQVKLIRK